ncbi:muts domain V-domain-containing protein [Lipomyces tetrasporus]|uniref:DNA mismatch repair protein MSH3 n=1 Tax=Lipomyces tetrasporus TaxID=54092 RepID=A0AAD7VW16_9ASCO|nr:muts domain V-domain-containing protein [Lipomyces tetrasporus]KAJ8104123.1 muts domain V-domain-containing protein [Lipomyces tetrasporus]
MSTQPNNGRSQQTINRFFSVPTKLRASSESALQNGIVTSETANATNGNGSDHAPSSSYQQPKRSHFGTVNGNVENKLASVKLDRLKNFVNTPGKRAEVQEAEAVDDADRTAKRRKIAGNGRTGADILEARRRLSMISVQGGRSGEVHPPAVESEDRVSAEEDADEEESSTFSALRNRFGAEGDSEPPSSRGSRGSKGKASTAKPKKLTPMVQQYIDIKRQHMDTIIAFEVGYKFYFYGEDARVASRELNIVFIPGWMTIEEATSTNPTYEKFASSIVPIERIYFHTKRLTEKGYKVGIVRQLETAALKAAGSNRNTVFKRELAEVYTKGTIVDDFSKMGGMVGESQSSGFIFSMCEESFGNNQNVAIGIIALSPSTGQVIFEEFEDGFMRGELETRLLHIQPCEIVLIGDITKESEKVLKTVASHHKVSSENIRSERIDKPSVENARDQLTRFYGNKMQSWQSDDADKKIGDVLEYTQSLPASVIVCLSAMIEFLKEYKLEGIFELPSCFEDFKSRSHMILNGNTLSSLEIYRNQTDFTEKGSLFWALDQTRTRFGQRLLRKWVGNPLIDREQLELRIAAVEEVKESRSERWSTLVSLLAKLPDLENGLIRIHYGRCTRSELYVVLRAFDQVCSAFPTAGTERPWRSEIINECFALLPKMSFEISEFLSEFDHTAAQTNDKYHFFKDEDQYRDIQDEKLGILSVENELDTFIVEARKLLKKSYVKYSSWNGNDYLIELRNQELRTVPKNWVKVSGTKNVSRFHAPEVISLIRERDQRREALTIACEQSYKQFLIKISEKYQDFRNIVQALAKLDCLLSLVAVSKMPCYIKPTFVDEPCIKIEGGRHPMVEQLLLSSFVPNDINISSSGTHAMVITGPNMGGKSSFVRQTALIAIMGQIGCYVPAQSATLGVLDAVYTRMGAYDNIMAGESTFMVELHECSDIIRSATPRSLVLLDEVGRGTGPIDGVAIAHSVLSHFITDIRALTLFITHYPMLCSFANRHPKHVANYYMGYMERQTEDGETDIAFLYRAVPGIAHRSYGLNVARLADLPKSILNCAAEKSAELEKSLTATQRLNWALSARREITSENPNLEELLSLEEYL